MKRDDALLCLSKLRERTIELCNQLSIRYESNDENIMYTLNVIVPSEASQELGNLIMIRLALVRIVYNDSDGNEITNQRDITLVNLARQTLGMEIIEDVQVDSSLFQVINTGLSSVSSFFSHAYEAIRFSVGSVIRFSKFAPIVPIDCHNSSSGRNGCYEPESEEENIYVPCVINCNPSLRAIHNEEIQTAVLGSFSSFDNNPSIVNI